MAIERIPWDAFNLIVADRTIKATLQVNKHDTKKDDSDEDEDGDEEDEEIVQGKQVL